MWLRLRAAAGGNWTPDGTLQLEGEPNFSCLGAHSAPKNYFVWGYFPKIEWAPAYVGSRPAVDGDFEQIASTVHAKRRHRARLLKRVDLGLERDDLDLLRVALDLESANDVVFLAELDNLAGGLVH